MSVIMVIDTFGIKIHVEKLLPVSFPRCIRLGLGLGLGLGLLNTEHNPFKKTTALKNKSRKEQILMLRAGLIFVFIILSQLSEAQTCCSGGVPISSNIGFDKDKAGVLNLAFGYDENVLQTLNTGTKVLEDNSRSRKTKSYIFRSAWTFKNHWSIESFIPLIDQNRTIKNQNTVTDNESSFGIGDPIIMVGKHFKIKKTRIAFSLGPKLPIGSYTKRNSRDLLLLEDLQPGSGAWDGILFSSLKKEVIPLFNGLFYFNSIYSLRGVNNNSRNGLQAYKFGNDLQLISGLSFQLLALKNIIEPGLSVRYRIVERDQVDNNMLPATGGQFIFTRLHLGLPIANIGTLNLNAAIPIYAKVNETQLTPTYSFNISWTKNILIRKEKLMSIKI